MNKDRKKGVYSVASKHPAAGAAESCWIYYNVKPSLKDRAYCKAGMPDYQNVKEIEAITECVSDLYSTVKCKFAFNSQRCK